MRKFLLIFCLFLVEPVQVFSTDYLVSLLQRKDGLSDNKTTCIHCYGNRRIAIGTHNGLNIFDGSSVCRVNNSDFEITSLYCDEDFFYVGAENGLYEYSSQTNSLTPIYITTQWGVRIFCHVSDICRCANRIIVSTIGQGVFILDTTDNTLRQYSVRIPFAMGLAAVSDNNIVIASRDEGLLSVNLYTMNVTPVCNIPSVQSVIYYHDRLWCVLEDGRAGYIEKSVFCQVLADVRRLSVYNDTHIIATCSDRLVLLDSGGAVSDTWNLFHDSHRIADYTSVSNVIDYEGNLWIPLRSSGLVKLPANRIVIYEGNTLEENPDPNSCVDKDGNSYRMIKNHVFKYDAYGKTTAVYIYDLTPQVLFADRDGMPWVGTRENGLRRGFVATPVETLDGQVTCVYSIKQDEYDFLWLACNLGIVRLDPRTLQARVIAGHEILPQTESFVPETAPVSSDGTVRFLTASHTLEVNPSLYCMYREIPCAEIASIGFRNSSDVLLVRDDGPIHIPYSGNSPVFNLAMPTYVRPESNGFRYMLSGEDSSMSAWSKNTSVTYNGLKPGKYQFIVEGMSGDGLVSTHAKVYEVIVDPEWWNGKLAITCYIMFVMLLLAGAVVLSMKRVRASYARKLQNARQRMETESYKQKMNFFLGMVHEIRTPLTMMRLSLEKMSNASSKDSKDDATKVLVENLNTIGETINGILNYQNNESQGAQLLMVRTDLKTLCAHSARQSEDMARLKGLTLSCSLPDKPVYIMADEVFFSKILNNLISNALKYARHAIEISLCVEQKSAVLRVNDDGPGVDPEQRNLIFDMFYKVSGDKVAESSGMGIGLAYARQLASAHNAVILQENLPEGGASFMVRIPLLEAEDLPEGGAEYTRTSQNENPGQMNRVLIVEDNASLCSMLEEELSVWYDVHKASNGAEALSILESTPVDIIVSDVMMPVMDGLELCKTIKSKSEYNHIPFIMLTAKVSIQAKAEGLESGADAYVEKPFSVAQIKAQIDNLLRLREYSRMAVMSGVGTGKPADSEYVNKSDREFLQKIDELIETQIREAAFSIDALAEEMCMSKSNFYRKFHAVTGSSPNEYLKNFRLNRAAQLIREGARINEAAINVGFYSSSYFAKCFFAKFGVLPKDYLNSK